MEKDLCGENQFREEIAQTRGEGNLKGTPSLGESMSGPTAGSTSLYLKGMGRQHPRHYTIPSHSGSLGVSRNHTSVNYDSVSDLSLLWYTGAEESGSFS